VRTGRRWLFIFLIGAIGPACDSKPAGASLPAVPPTALVATAVTTARIDLTWVDASNNEFEFRIERADAAGGPYSLVAAVPMNTTAYSDLGLLPNKQYFYQVSAWNSAGLTTPAGPANATTKALTWKSSIGGPGFRGSHSAIYDSLGRRMILFGGEDDFLTLYNDLWSLDLLPTTATLTTPPSDHWTSLGVLPGAPTERMGHSAIYDTANNRMIVFGGQVGSGYDQEVYVLTLGVTPAWSAPAIAGTKPSERAGHTAVYDAANQRMVIFGGNDSISEKADAHFLSLPASPPFTWSPLPGSGPVKRTDHSAIYDGLRGQMIIFGGLDNEQLPDGSVLNNDTWSLRLGPSSAWAQLSFPGTPFFRFGHAAVYDAVNQRMVVFGGTTSTTPPYGNELWSLRLDQISTWTFLTPTSGTPPPARFGHTAIYDSGRERMVIFGGYDNSGFAVDDTWLSDF
jgi:hypothetical protein